jgi:hypothetical protein
MCRGIVYYLSMLILILIYLLIAIGLTSSGSSTVHIYTQTPGSSSTVHIYTQTPGGSSTVHIYTQTPGGSSTVHIYTQTIYRTRQLKTVVGRFSGIRTQIGQTKINEGLTA